MTAHSSSIYCYIQVESCIASNERGLQAFALSLLAPLHGTCANVETDVQLDHTYSHKEFEHYTLEEVCLGITVGEVS